MTNIASAKDWVEFVKKFDPETYSNEEIIVDSVDYQATVSDGSLVIRSLSSGNADLIEGFGYYSGVHKKDLGEGIAFMIDETLMTHLNSWKTDFEPELSELVTDIETLKRDLSKSQFKAQMFSDDAKKLTKRLKDSKQENGEIAKREADQAARILALESEIRGYVRVTKDLTAELHGATRNFEEEDDKYESDEISDDDEEADDSDDEADDSEEESSEEEEDRMTIDSSMASMRRGRKGSAKKPSKKSDKSDQKPKAKKAEAQKKKKEVKKKKKGSPFVL